MSLRPALAFAAMLAFAAAAAQTPPPVEEPMPAVSSPAPKPLAAAPGTQPQAKTMDRLELDPTSITGNRELPKVMVIVPWKRSDIGDLTGRPANSLLNEVLTPVDRDVFRRELRYFDAVQPAEAAEAETQGKDSGPQ